MMGGVRRLWRPWAGHWYRACVRLLRPVNWLLVPLLRTRVIPKSVLHVSEMVHVPYHTTRVLRRHGWQADYLAISTSPHWNASDFVFVRKSFAWLAFQEWLFFWRVVARYEVHHLHFMLTMSSAGWELPVLKRLGRRIVVHYRGCEVRDREKNMALHPDINICQRCDYNASICRSPFFAERRRLADRYADHFLITTPDMKDFVPDAEHLPFFAPELVASEREVARGPERRWKIVHATNHPGIEGSAEIQSVVDRLKARGYPIDYVYLKNVPHERVLAELRDADLSIGKMKMGYYANAQVESMALGVPAVTYVRRELMTESLKQSGFVFSALPDLERTLEGLLARPGAIEEKRRIARRSILELHDNDAIARRLIDVYEGRGRSRASDESPR